MKLFIVQAKSNLDKSFLDKLSKYKFKEKKLGVVTTIQFLHSIDEIKKALPNHEIVLGGQVIGCNATNAIKINKDVDAFLYIGSGRFHPLEVAFRTKKNIYIANPYINEIKLLDQKDVELEERRSKGRLLKFLSSKKIGIIVSVKPGQQNLKKALELKELLKDKKDSFIFVTNNVSELDFENFPDVEYWVNTACARIEGKKIIDIGEIYSAGVL